MSRFMMILSMLVMVLAPSGEAFSARPLKLGVINILENEDLLTLRDTFVSEMKGLGYDLTVDYFNADSINHPDDFVQRGNGAAEKMRAEGVEMFLTLGMYPRVVQSLGQIPTIDPSHVPVAITADVYKNENGKTYCRGNATGTLLTYPFDAVMEFVEAVVPRAKKIAYIYNPDSPQSRPVAEVEAEAKKIGRSVVACPFSNYDTGMEAVRKAIREADVAFGTNDIYIAGFHADGIKLGNEKQFPILVGIVPLVNAGAVAAMQLDWERAAQICARKADAVLKGQKANTIAIDKSDKHQIGLNLKIAEKMGLEIPYAWIENAAVIVE